MDCCKRKIEEVLAARELYSLKCSLLAKQIFLFLLVLAKKSQCSACSRMLAKTICHPFICLPVSRVFVCLRKENQLRDCRATVNAKSHAGKKPLLAG